MTYKSTLLSHTKLWFTMGLNPVASWFLTRIPDSATAQASVPLTDYHDSPGIVIYIQGSDMGPYYGQGLG
jgi:hypothetical protein